MAVTVIDDLNALIHHVTTSYAGFQDKTQNRLAQLGSLTAMARKRMREASSVEEQTALLREWLNFFDDPHMRLEAPRTQGKFTGNDKREELRLAEVDSDTLLLRIPTCAHSLADPINRLLDAGQKALTSTKYLIVDLRGNGGGTEYVFFGLIPLLYTGPITRTCSDFWASPENTAYLRAGLNSCGLPEEALKGYRAVLDRMEANPNSMVPGLPDETIVFEEILPRPERMGILIDRACGSATEEFLLLAKQSTKVILFGENTSGCLDYANERDIILPSGRFMLRVPISRSRRLPDHPVDHVGIPPDVRLPPAVADPVIFVQNYFPRLDRQADRMELG